MAKPNNDVGREIDEDGADRCSSELLILLALPPAAAETRLLTWALSNKSRPPVAAPTTKLLSVSPRSASHTFILFAEFLPAVRVEERLRGDKAARTPRASVEVERRFRRRGLPLRDVSGRLLTGDRRLSLPPPPWDLADLRPLLHARFLLGVRVLFGDRDIGGNSSACLTKSARGSAKMSRT